MHRVSPPFLLEQLQVLREFSELSSEVGVLLVLERMLDLLWEMESMLHLM